MNRVEFETVMIQNPAAAALAAMGLATARTTALFHSGLRDDAGNRVFRDESGVIFLEKAVHDDDWSRIGGAGYTQDEPAAAARPDDDGRRFRLLEPMLAGARLLDYGMGDGGFARRSAAICHTVEGVEPRADRRDELRRHLGSSVAIAETLDDFQPGYDVITLFHVLDRITKPVSLLSKLQSLLRPGGCLVVELPNAGNALIEDIDLPAYRDFIFSSGELVMFTRAALEKFLAGLGFTGITVHGVQRYGLAAHAGWLLDGTAGGESRYGDRATPENAAAYEESLVMAGRTDTLFALAYRPLP